MSSVISSCSSCSKVYLKGSWKWILVSLLIVGLDQATKQYVFRHFLPYDPLTVGSYLNIILAYNRGAAFSLFAEASGWQGYLFGGIAVSTIAVLIRWLVRLPATENLQALAYSCIMAGAAGNLLDRFRLGFVIDFIDFHYQNAHFATFNIADSAICLGAALLILKLLWSPKHENTVS